MCVCGARTRTTSIIRFGIRDGGRWVGHGGRFRGDGGRVYYVRRWGDGVDIEAAWGL